jgi:hypothetical protein
MKMRINTFLLAMLAVALCSPVSAQKLEELKEKYPGQDAVVLNNSIRYRITVKDGEPYVVSKENEQLMYLSANAAAYMSRYSFTQSVFH